MAAGLATSHVVTCSVRASFPGPASTNSLVAQVVWPRLTSMPLKPIEENGESGDVGS